MQEKSEVYLLSTRDIGDFRWICLSGCLDGPVYLSPVLWLLWRMEEVLQPSLSSIAQWF